jgi:hypothetical protein
VGCEAAAVEKPKTLRRPSKTVGVMRCKANHLIRIASCQPTQMAIPLKRMKSNLLGSLDRLIAEHVA